MLLDVIDDGDALVDKDHTDAAAGASTGQYAPLQSSDEYVADGDGGDGEGAGALGTLATPPRRNVPMPPTPTAADNDDEGMGVGYTSELFEADNHQDRRPAI
jgi:hypothetical protein